MKLRKVISLLLAVSLVSLIAMPVAAAESEKRNIYRIMNPTESEMYQQMLRQLPSDEAELIKKGLLDPSQAIAPLLSTRSTTQGFTAYYTSMNMPIASFYIVAKGWQDGTYTSATYNDNDCFKFTLDDDTVYVRKNVLHPDSYYYDIEGFISKAAMSTTLTIFLNNDNTDWAYHGHYRLQIDPYGQRWVRLVVWATQAFHYSSNELCLSHKVIVESEYALSTMSADKFPTLKLEITNTGSGGRYFGGYYMKGTGAYCSITNIADAIDLGYKAVKVAASTPVSGLSFNTVYGIFKIAVGLNKTGSGDNRSYVSETVSLSNPAKNVYGYSVELTSPYKLIDVGHYFQTHIGLYGTDSSTLEYKVTFNSGP